MVVGKFLSLNVRGISNFRKRRTTFTWCKTQKVDVIFLQETHSTKDNELFWKRDGALLSIVRMGLVTLAGERY